MEIANEDASPPFLFAFRFNPAIRLFSAVEETRTTLPSIGFPAAATSPSAGLTNAATSELAAHLPSFEKAE